MRLPHFQQMPSSSRPKGSRQRQARLRPSQAVAVLDRRYLVAVEERLPVAGRVRPVAPFGA
jgi:hypothetical protein